MDMAERKGSDLRFWLASADFFSDLAISLGSSDLNKSGSSASASLCSVTSCDHFPAVFFAAGMAGPPHPLTTRANRPARETFRPADDACGVTPGLYAAPVGHEAKLRLGE